MKTKILFTIGALLMWSIFAAETRAELVDFSGVTADGGVFSTSVDGNIIIGVTVGPLTQVGADGSDLESNIEGAVLRMITRNSGGGYDVGDQSSITITLDQPDSFILSTNSGDSAADGRDIIRFTPLGVPSGGPDFWTVTDTANVDVFEDVDHVLTLDGNGGDFIFMTYRVHPNTPIASFEVTHYSNGEGPTLNTHRFDLSVSGITVVGVPAVSPLGFLVFSALLLSIGFLMVRSQLGG